MNRTLGGIDEGKGGARRRGVAQGGGGEPRRAELELLMAVDLHALPRFRGLHMIDYSTASVVKKCLITHQAQMGTGNPQSHLDCVTKFQDDTAEVFLITNHTTFNVAWCFGTLRIPRIL